VEPSRSITRSTFANSVSPCGCEAVETQRVSLAAGRDVILEPRPDQPRTRANTRAALKPSKRRYKVFDTDDVTPTLTPIH
jgi:hypothetical protein